MVATDRERIAAGERPRYHVTWTPSQVVGATDVNVVELPIVHLFVPDPGTVLDGARILIAQTLGVPLDAFDVEFERDG